MNPVHTYTYGLSYFQVKVYHTLSNLPAFRPHSSSPRPCNISRPRHFPLFNYFNNDVKYKPKEMILNNFLHPAITSPFSYPTICAQLAYY